MKKKDLAIYAVSFVCLTIAILIHQSMVKNKPASTSSKKVSEVKKPTLDHRETKTKVTFKEIIERPAKKSKKPLIEHKPKFVTQKKRETENKRLSNKVTISKNLLDSSLLKIGGRFFVMDMIKKEIKAEIDIQSGSLKEVGSLRGLSPRSRNISNESGTKGYLHSAQKQYGSSYYSVVLLLPLTIDSLLVAGMDKSLKKLNLSNTNFHYFRGFYEKERDNLLLKIISGKTKDGEIFAFNIVFNLTQVSMI